MLSGLLMHGWSGARGGPVLGMVPFPSGQTLHCPTPSAGPASPAALSAPTESCALCQARPHHADPEAGSEREVR